LECNLIKYSRRKRRKRKEKKEIMKKEDWDRE